MSERIKIRQVDDLQLFEAFRVILPQLNRDDLGLEKMQELEEEHSKLFYEAYHRDLIEEICAIRDLINKQKRSNTK